MSNAAPLPCFLLSQVTRIDTADLTIQEILLQVQSRAEEMDTMQVRCGTVRCGAVHAVQDMQCGTCSTALHRVAAQHRDGGRPGASGRAA